MDLGRLRTDSGSLAALSFSLLDESLGRGFASKVAGKNLRGRGLVPPGIPEERRRWEEETLRSPAPKERRR